MKKYLVVLAAIAALTVAGCKKESKTPEVIVDPDAALEGSGNLVYGTGSENETETGHTYSWKMDGSAITVDVNINTEEAIERGDWEMGIFELPTESFYEFTGALINSLTESSFICYEPDGTEVEEMTSYKPGMWVDGDSYSTGWSTGCMYWQWYVWEGLTDKDGDTIGYDYEGLTGYMIIGTNPSNLSAAQGKTLTSKAKIDAGGKTFDFVVNVTFSAAEIAENWDESAAETAASGEGYLKAVSDNFDTTDGGEELEWAPVKWDFSKDAIKIEATYSIAAADGAWAYGYKKFDMAKLSEIVGVDIATTTLDNFYPVEADGETAYVNSDGAKAWTTYAPGQWVNADGNGCGWSDGHMYWWMQPDEETTYENLRVDGAWVFGTNPSNVAAGEDVTSKAILNGIPVEVTLHVVE